MTQARAGAVRGGARKGWRWLHGGREVMSPAGWLAPPHKAESYPLAHKVLQGF